MPRAALPYVPGVYRPDSTIAQMMLQQGQQEADSTREMYGQIAGGVQAAGQAYGAHRDEQQAKKEERKIVQQKKADLGQVDDAVSQSGLPDFDVDAVAQKLPGHLRAAFRENVTKSRAEGAKLDESRANYFGYTAASIEAWLDSPDGGIGAAKIGMDDARARGYGADVDKLEAQLKANPGSLRPILESLKAKAPAFAGKVKAPGTREIKTENADGSSTVQIVSDTPGQTFQSAAPIPKAPNAGTFEDYLVKTVGKDASPEAILKARKDYNQADDRPRITVNTGSSSDPDVKDVVQGMIDGTTPPQLPGKASKQYTAIQAEAKRRGFNLAQAATDWAATQRHVSTLNGPAQTRLNQSINALPELLDSVDTLASEWKGGKWPALNKASLAAAKAGAQGPEAASVANKLEAQIADVVADLGQVYMGGNSPTDHSLSLAAKSLSGDWSEKTLHDMVKMAKANVIIRRNSIQNTGVAGASTGNLYAGQPHGAPPDAPAGKPGDGLGIR